MKLLPLPAPPHQSAGEPAPGAPDGAEHRQIVYRVLFHRQAQLHGEGRSHSATLATGEMNRRLAA